MKKIIYIVLLFSFFACSKKKESTPAPSLGHGIISPSPTSKILILKINYVDYVFEGGKEIVLTSTVQTKDSIPFKIIYKSSSDFGDISIYHLYSNDRLFYGSIIWMGRGSLFYPTKFDTSTTFSKMSNVMMKPDSTRFQTIYFGYPTESADGNKLWKALNNLEVVNQYLNYNKKIAVYCYTPSVGFGNPYEWDWIVFMSN